MRKIPCLFKKEYENAHQYHIINEVNPECQWVLDGEGVATRKFDGTAVMIKDGICYQRYDAKVKKGAKPIDGKYTLSDFKSIPLTFIPCQDEPDFITGHYPGWVPANDKRILEAFEVWKNRYNFPEGTFECVGPKINGNPEGVDQHELWMHGCVQYYDGPALSKENLYPLFERTLEGIKLFLEKRECEGIVFHHPDGRMCKIRRVDYRIPWKRHK